MKGLAAILIFGGPLLSVAAAAQEANSGVDLRATVTAQAVSSSELMDGPRFGAAVTPGARSVFYPTIKFSDHWGLTGAYQIASRPFSEDDFSSTGYGAKGRALQTSLNYTRISDKGLLLLRAGVLSSAFGSFLLRYDDADNPLIALPPGYGYYGAAVSSSGLAGAQADVTRGKFDARVQLANSSPANPRSIFAADQYVNWAGGAGFTLRQGFRIGVSGYHGPYLSHDFPYYFPGEAPPATLPARALGVDASLARGHWNFFSEWQKFAFPYTVIPEFREQAGYIEARRALGPRWFAAARTGFTLTASTHTESYEFVAGFRPDRSQILKVGYRLERYSLGSEDKDQTATIQLITQLHFASAHR